MDRHLTPAIRVLRRSQRLCLPEIAAAAGPVCAELEAHAQASGLAIDGPPIFTAQGLPDDAETPFDWAACLPVADAQGMPADEPHVPSGQTELTVLPPLSCARTEYVGPLAELFAHGYQPLLRAIAEAGLRPSGASREVYHVWRGPEAPDNRIEIQIGIAA